MNRKSSRSSPGRDRGPRASAKSQDGTPGKYQLGGSVKAEGLGDGSLEALVLVQQRVGRRREAFFIQIGFQEMKNKLNTAIHQFAKRQETWFRRMERKGIVINWVEGDNYPALKEGVLKHLS